uniref:COP1-interacting protein 7 n=1 Tax=Anthurium amnicola TaxID=1678845 RepID=A0A1D1YBF0_9ARAE
MNSDTALDFALFQLSPRRSRCELFVSSDGKTEKLASGLLKPFITHLKAAEEQAAQAVKSIKLEVEKRKHAGAWFNKGTLERFVRFVSTPEVLEVASTLDTEMSQLEGARRIYSQGAGDQLPGALGECEIAVAASPDVTKKDLLRAIDVRLVAVRQDLTMACARASAAGFTVESVSELRLFADHFGAHRLNEACGKFLSLCQRRPELIARPQEHQQQPPPPPPAAWRGLPLGVDDRNVRGSSGSDMSIDEPEEPPAAPSATRPLGAPWPSSSTASSSNAGQQQQHPQRPFRARSVEPPTSQEQKAAALTKSSSSHKIADGEGEPSTSTGHPGGGSRRLSVQDRINLFENKQKEQAGGGVVGGIGGKAGGKAELRRLSSDVSSSVEKTVLRRWSGASDMSIDLPGANNSGNNQKEPENAATTPSSSSACKPQVSGGYEEKDTGGSQPRSGVEPVASLSSSQFSSFVKRRDCTEDTRPKKDRVASAGEHLSTLEQEKPNSQVQSGSSSRFSEASGLGGQSAAQNNLKSSSSVADNNLRDQAASSTQQKSLAGVAENPGSIHKAAPWIQVRAFPGSTEQVVQKEQGTSQREQPSGAFSNKVIPAGLRETGTTDNPQVSSARHIPGQLDDANVEQPVSLNRFKSSGNKAEDMGLHRRSGTVDSQVQQKSLIDKAESSVPKIETFAPQSHGKSFPGKPEETRKSESVTQAQVRAFSTKLKAEEDSDARGIKLHRQTSTSGQKIFHDWINEGTPTNEIHLNSQGNAQTSFLGWKVGETTNTFDPASSSAVEPVQMVRPSKGNQELNDELQLKADELEKLFAAHKLRLHGDQTAASRRGKPVDPVMDNLSSVSERRLADVLPNRLPERRLARDPPINGTEFDADTNMSKQKLVDLSPSEDSRGKFYERYMQKRDAKLREEWDLKRAHKEAEMKKMHDDLERSRAEMKAKFARSADRQDSALYAHRRAEKLRSFGLSLSMKSKEQQLEFFQSEEEEDQESSEQTLYSHDTCFNETLAGDSSSRSNSSKKLLSSRSVSSSTPRTSAVSIPRPSVRGSNLGSGRRWAQPENLLAQSVPNFSDLRKENTKPSSGSSKITTRSQSRNFSRSKSTSEEINLVKEEKSRRSQSTRKASASPGELKELSSVNSDSVILTPVNLSKDQSDLSTLNKVHKSGESKPFLRKGSGIGPGAGAGIVKSKMSAASENLKNGEASESVDEPKDSPYRVKEEEDDDFERISVEEAAMAEDFPAASDNEKQSSGNSGEPGSDNGEASRSLSQVDDDSSVALAAIASKFNTCVGVVQESPGESPGSWNSHMNHSFSYAHEASDVDASVDSPVGSPASWNSHSLNQMEADVARMRRKWGNAQKPLMIANSSSRSRKDVTKGFKRLLKFGRKSKGSESLVTDWVSASTTSEGDDDTEDGRDPANKSSDDLRKTRMGFSQYHYNHDGFNEGETFHEQAPRSFFSLSSFRSKGSESKLR